MNDYYQYPVYAKESKDIPDWMKDSQNWQNAVHVDTLQKYQMKVKMCCLKCEEKVVEEIREVHGVFDVKSDRSNSKVVIVVKPLPNGLNEHKILRRVRKVDKQAKFVELSASEKPKTEEQKKEEEKEKHEAAIANMFTRKPLMVPVHLGAGGPIYYVPQPDAYYPGEYVREFMIRQKEEERKKEVEEKKKKEEAENKKKDQKLPASTPFIWIPSSPQWGGPYYAPHPYPCIPEELREYRPPQWYAPRFQYPPLPFQLEGDEFSRPYFYYT